LALVTNLFNNNYYSKKTIMKKLIVLLPLVFLFAACSKDTTDNQTIATSYVVRPGADEQQEPTEPEEHDDGGTCCSFKYGAWSTCADGYQVRSWSSRSTLCIPPLDSIQRTCASAIVYYLYYNAQYLSLRVVCNWPGLIHIYNVQGQLVSILNYGNAMTGIWVRVGFLPPGVYRAFTYNRGTTFTIQ
jgi:hypothetical protein